MNQPQPQKFDASTEKFASLNHVKSQTIRARYCITGSYFGVMPITLANGRLLWPSVQVQKGAL